MSLEIRPLATYQSYKAHFLYGGGGIALLGVCLFKFIRLLLMEVKFCVTQNLNVK